MQQAEIEDVFSEFDIDEDYMVKTKEVLGLFVAQKEEEKKGGHWPLFFFTDLVSQLFVNKPVQGM